ncbi:MAG TPA: TadE/TadG family type IV pilus assembly protein [Sphingobium sp.]
MIPSALRRISQDRRGASLPEFGLICIPLFTLLLGGMDMGYQLYVRAVMQGALQNASRLTTVLTDSTLSNDTTIETALKAEIEKIAPKGATVTVTKGSFYQFSAINQMEPLTKDINGNGVLDAPNSSGQKDCWLDVDDDGTRNVVVNGKTGIGGADDLVKYSATVSYKRLLPIYRFVNMSDTATMSASIMARRQPYRDQDPPTERCRTS